MGARTPAPFGHNTYIRSQRRVFARRMRSRGAEDAANVGWRLRVTSPLGTIDHTFLTSLVDRAGSLRVQYMGVRFDPDEMLRDLRSLLREGGR